MSLSDRIRPNCEAAVWVCEEVEKLERENAALTKDVCDLVSKNEALIAENAVLREDLDRLDWLEARGPWECWTRNDEQDIVLKKPIRAAIDAARKEEKQ